MGVYREIYLDLFRNFSDPNYVMKKGTFELLFRGKKSYSVQEVITIPNLGEVRLVSLFAERQPKPLVVIALNDEQVKMVKEKNLLVSFYCRRPSERFVFYIRLTEILFRSLLNKFEV